MTISYNYWNYVFGFFLEIIQVIIQDHMQNKMILTRSVHHHDNVELVSDV